MERALWRFIASLGSSLLQGFSEELDLSPLFVGEVVVGCSRRSASRSSFRFQSPLRRGGCRRDDIKGMQAWCAAKFQSPLRQGGCRRLGATRLWPTSLPVSVPSSSGRLSSVFKADDALKQAIGVSVPSSSGRLSSAAEYETLPTGSGEVSVPSSSGRLSSVGRDGGSTP